MRRCARILLPFMAVFNCAACSSSGPGDLAPTASFHADVVPIFVASCSFATTCHGDRNRGQAGLYLGRSSNDGADADAVYENLVGVKATIAPMIRVTPGDPGNSFLMHKLDRDQNTSGISCNGAGLNGGPCGDGMPVSGDELSTAKRELVRIWIRDGAARN